MIFVSYCHADEEWRKEFQKFTKPLSRYLDMKFWSDKELQEGKWDQQIKGKMGEAKAVVFLVSVGFLASDYVIKTELPFFLKANRDHKVKVFWMKLEPCDVQRGAPELLDFLSLTRDQVALSSLTEPKWKAKMLIATDMIDDAFKYLEKPEIHPSARNAKVEGYTERFELLAKPARRQVWVLVYSPDKKWWVQGAIPKGGTKAKLWAGDAKTKAGTQFQVVAVTSDRPLSERHYLGVPKGRTESETITITRK
jgi:hypothetical protein